MLKVNNLIGFGQAKRKYRVYTDAKSSTADTLNYTFTGVNIGDPAGDRVIVVGAVGGFGLTANRVMTINGVTATETTGAGSYGTRSCLFYASVPTGSSVTVVLSGTTTNMSSIYLSFYALYGLDNAAPFEVVTATVGATSVPFVLQQAAPGDLFFAAVAGASGTWTWPTPMVEHFDGVVESTLYGTAASGQSDSTTSTIVATHSVTSTVWGTFGQWR
jgi:hypothetical protein